LYVCETSRTSRAKGSFRSSSSVDRWYFRISRRATVPGLRRGRESRLSGLQGA
jgi:hypothetical protein